MHKLLRGFFVISTSTALALALEAAEIQPEQAAEKASCATCTGSLVDAGTSRRGLKLGAAIAADAPMATPISGARILNVKPESPAAKAGLQSEDVVIEFDSRPIRKATDLLDALQSGEPGARITVMIVRGTETKTLVVQF